MCVRGRESERESACVCVCGRESVCVCEREIARESVCVKERDSLADLSGTREFEADRLRETTADKNTEKEVVSVPERISEKIRVDL